MSRSRTSRQAIGFYSALFAAQPAVVKPDYAKWMLDDPRVNFAISTRGREPGLDHLGIQVESEDELQEVYGRLREAGGDDHRAGQTTCCYAKSEKSWIDDPAGISWETFFTTGESTVYGDGSGREARVAHAKACCAPQGRLAQAEAAGLLHGMRRHGRSSLQRAVSLHRQLGALDHRRGILNKLGAGKFRAYSAGSQPKGQVNPHTIQLLQGLGYDTSGFRSKSWNEFAKPGAPASISCSRSATTPPAKPARCGRASR